MAKFILLCKDIFLKIFCLTEAKKIIIFFPRDFRGYTRNSTFMLRSNYMRNINVALQCQPIQNF